MTPVRYRSDVEQVIPQQSVFNEARRRFMDEQLAFNPVHAIKAHRPLGSIMRARMRIYVKTKAFRQ